jgi:hypothetical protein
MLAMMEFCSEGIGIEMRGGKFARDREMLCCHACVYQANIDNAFVKIWGMNREMRTPPYMN